MICKIQDLRNTVQTKKTGDRGPEYPFGTSGPTSSSAACLPSPRRLLSYPKPTFTAIQKCERARKNAEPLSSSLSSPLNFDTKSGSPQSRLASFPRRLFPASRSVEKRANSSSKYTNPVSGRSLHSSFSKTTQV
jgi:hypothetical protein